jgi:hypothetical protein
MPGLIRHAFFTCRKVGDDKLKVVMGAWTMTYHDTSIHEPEFTKYLPIFRTLDQKFIDKYLDDEQKRLNAEDDERERIENEARVERERLAAIQLVIRAEQEEERVA